MDRKREQCNVTLSRLSGSAVDGANAAVKAP